MVDGLHYHRVEELAVACPFCGSRPDELCTYPAEEELAYSLWPHASRVKVATHPTQETADG